MDPLIFIRHKEQNPDLEFTLIKSEIVPIEKTWFNDYGVFSVFRRDFYKKSNGKKCYVDYFLKEINVERNMLCPCKNEYFFRIKNKFIKEVLKTNGIEI